VNLCNSMFFLCPPSRAIARPQIARPFRLMPLRPLAAARFASPPVQSRLAPARRRLATCRALLVSGRSAAAPPGRGNSRALLSWRIRCGVRLVVQATVIRRPAGPWPNSPVQQLRHHSVKTQADKARIGCRASPALLEPSFLPRWARVL